ncbi:DEAD/DEAH box helicase [Streptomyces sp. SCSIO 75703]|uniref:DEAD/DEAH box helicase n=1 Tax=Streptomyces sp. SCSIO 75703 TaxID=3112165 RepID=UPI0030CAA7A8
MAADVPGTVATTPALASHRAHRRGSTLTTTFRSLGILPETAEALEAVGIVHPFPIQEMTLPVALSGTDVIGQAKTGTGKTLGFGLPLLERVTVPADVEAGRAAPESLTDAPQALVVVPTRELCQQVTNDLLTAGKVRNVRVTAIYGGRAYEPQVEALKKGVDVVVGTPGRLLDLAGQRKLDLKHVRCLVLDEADEMLDLGFLPDVEKIVTMLPAKRQTMLFSATMPGAVIGLARRYMSQPTHIRATSPDDEGATVANIKQFVYRAHSMDKPEMVSRILQAEGRGLAMIFCRTKRTAADIAEQLQRRGFAAGAVHGDLGQGAREQALRAFRNGKVDVLVCTDVAARGIDVEGVTHVVNYQSPEEEKTYLHRVGRTGRAGAKGTAITLVDWDDIPRWQLINKALVLDFNDPPETYSTSPHLYSDLGIPEGTKGVLPRSERTRAGLAAEELEDLGEPGGRGGRGGRGPRGRDESRSGDREQSSRTPRRRRRMRGGEPVDAGAAPAEAPAAGDTDTDTEAGKGPRTLRRRRRTRNGEAARPQVTAGTPADETAEAAHTAVATAEGTDVRAVEAPATEPADARPRRRRTRKSAEAAPVETVETAPVATAPVAGRVTEPEAAEAPVAEAPAEKPRRRTRKAAATAEAVLDTAEAVAEAPAAEAVEATPRRTRKTTAGKAVETEAVTDAPGLPAQPEAEAAETKPRRARKTAAKKTAAKTAEAEVSPAEAAVDTAEGTGTTPRRRTRKATATAEAADTTEAAQPEAEAAEAKPRRTRKTAAKKTTAKTAEAEVSPAEAAVDTAEGTGTTPRRRTRKATATAEAADASGIPAQAAPEPEAAPKRRTRKTVASAEATGAAEGAAEAKPKARRTRKAATAAAEPAES